MMQVQHELMQRLAQTRERSGGGNLIWRLRAAKAHKPRQNLSHLVDMPALMARIEARGRAEFEEFCRNHPELADDDEAQEAAATSGRKPKRRSLIFRERDITRAIAGHLKAGLSVARVEVDTGGRIVIVTGKPEATELVPETSADLRRLI